MTLSMFGCLNTNINLLTGLLYRHLDYRHNDFRRVDAVREWPRFFAILQHLKIFKTADFAKTPTCFRLLKEGLLSKYFLQNLSKIHWNIFYLSHFALNALEASVCLYLAVIHMVTHESFLAFLKLLMLEGRLHVSVY